MKETKVRSEAGSRADSKLAVQKGKNVGKGGKLKRPASAFFVFMETFRVEYKENHPNNKSVAAVGKAGGAKWKAMSEAEKAPFVEMAAKRKSEYEKLKNQQAEDEVADAGSDKSKSEVEEDNEDEGED